MKNPYVVDRLTTPSNITEYAYPCPECQKPTQTTYRTYKPIRNSIHDPNSFGLLPYYVCKACADAYDNRVTS